MPVRLNEPVNPHCPRPTRAMVLAAGLGKRMRPLTETLPKPLVEVAGETLLDRLLDRLAAWNVESAVVNVHHLADQMRAHLAKRTAPKVEISDETDALLDTGGGVKRALPKLGTEPFFVLNSDVLWGDGPHPALSRLWGAFHPDDVDVVLLLQPTARAHGYDGHGDFLLSPDGVPERPGEGRIAPYVFAGAMLVHPRVYADVPEGAFSNNLIFDRAIAAGRLRGVAHDGAWYHVGTVEAIAATEKLLASSDE